MDLNRRKFLSASAGVAGISIAGCVEPGETVSELPRPTIGEDDAPVTVSVFEDYMCPTCQRFEQNVSPQIISNYVETGDVKYQYYDWPIPVQSRWSYEVANAARYVQDNLGSEVFFDFKSIMYDNQSNMSEDVIRTAGEEVGVSNVEELIEQAANSVYQPVIESDVDEGRERGVGGTPTVFVNGEVLPTFTFDVISSTVDAQL